MERYLEEDLIVEIGIGNRFNTFKKLKNNGFNVKAIDISPANSEIIKDDLFNAKIDIYQHASVIYMYRPSEEMQIQALRLSEAFSTDLVIRPLGTEIINLGKPELINLKKEPIYLWELGKNFKNF